MTKERDLTVDNLEKNLIKYIFKREIEEDRSYVVITSHPKDAMELDKELIKHMFNFNGVKPSVRDFKLLGFTLFIMRTQDVEVGKWVMTVGQNFTNQ